jgi:hypothetical protein
MKMLDEEF